MKQATSVKRGVPTAPIASPMVLTAATAAEIMRPNPLSIRLHASVQDALALLTDHEFGAVPVINKQGHPVGVLSRTDLVRFEREKVEYLGETARQPEEDELTLPSGENLSGSFLIENAPTGTVAEVMTPKVFSVLPTTPVPEVVHTMLNKHVHRLFVIDEEGVLIGVISTIDVLRALKS